MNRLKGVLAITQKAHGHVWKYAKGKVKYVLFSKIIWVYVLKTQNWFSNGLYIWWPNGEDIYQHSTVL